MNRSDRAAPQSATPAAGHAPVHATGRGVRAAPKTAGRMLDK